MSILPDTSGLAQGIQQAGAGLTTALGPTGALAQALQQKRERGYGTVLQEAFNQLGESPSPQEYQGALTQAIASGVPFKQAVEYGNMYANLTKAQPNAEKELIPTDTKNRLRSVFGRYDELLKTGSGLGYLGANPARLFNKGREDVAEFNTLGASIESALMPLVNKGNLAKPRFDYIMSLVPKSSDTKGTVIGKIKGLKREFGMVDQGTDLPKQAEQAEPNQSFRKPTLEMAKANPGKIIENKVTGEELISVNGKWIKNKGK